VTAERRHPEAEKGAAFLDRLRQEGAELDLAVALGADRLREPDRQVPPRNGPAAGRFDRKSWISFEDFAVAIADEIERPAHIGKRFTVGY
jgi:uncharacterized protein